MPFDVHAVIGQIPGHLGMALLLLLLLLPLLVVGRRALAGGDASLLLLLLLLLLLWWWWLPCLAPRLAIRGYWWRQQQQLLQRWLMRLLCTGLGVVRYISVFPALLLLLLLLLWLLWLLRQHQRNPLALHRCPRGLPLPLLGTVQSGCSCLVEGPKDHAVHHGDGDTPTLHAWPLDKKRASPWHPGSRRR